MTLSAAEVKNARIVPALLRAVTAWMTHFVAGEKNAKTVPASHKIATVLILTKANAKNQILLSLMKKEINLELATVMITTKDNFLPT